MAEVLTVGRTPLLVLFFPFLSFPFFPPVFPFISFLSILFLSMLAFPPSFFLIPCLSSLTQANDIACEYLSICNSIQMTIISTTGSKDPLEEME